MLTFVAAVGGVILANTSVRDAVRSVASATLLPGVAGLDLTISQWAQDGLLAFFFFMVGLELAQEFTVGSLREPRRAAAPFCAAIGGMIVPALVYTLVIRVAGQPELAHGWAVPTATDVAFALMVLAMFGRGLPPALRTFLLALAVVDDLLGILVIAVVYSGGVRVLPVLGACVTVGAFAVAFRVGRPRWWILVPLGVVAWGLLHTSGVHPTIAGAALGLTVPTRARGEGRGSRRERGAGMPPATRLDLAMRPFVNGIVLPVFAFFAAAVPVTAAAAASGERVVPAVAWAVALGLVLGKPVGVLATTWMLTRLTPIRLPDSIGVRDLLPVGFLTGIGFTVSMLIAGLSFASEGAVDTARMAVMAASLVSAVIGAILLRRDA